MSKLSQIYDALTSLIAGAVTGYQQMPNPYAPQGNNQLVRVKGFGLGVGHGRGTFLEAPLRGRERTFNILLVNQIHHLEHDTAGVQARDKAVLEDMLAIEMALEANNQLGGLCVKVDYQDDSGIQLLHEVNAQTNETQAAYVSVSMNILVTYQEPVA